jgi:hypothetical protein
MTDRFDEAKRALEGVPARDVWTEAERRAADGGVVPLAAAGAGGRRHRGRWLAAAAAVVLLAGTAVVLARNDDSPVDSGPPAGDDHPANAKVTTYQAEGACKLGIVGEPLPEPTEVEAVDTFMVDDAGQPALGTNVSGALSATQLYSVQVPGEMVIDLIGERVEDVEIARGTAQIWFMATPAVQLRWFTGSQDPCESFTVTVGGGTEDGNRHAALDLAERVLLPSELPDDEPTDGDNPLAGTTSTTPVASFADDVAGLWEIIDLRAGDTRVPLPAGELLVELLASEVSWTDGCTGHRADVTYEPDGLAVAKVTASPVGCPDDEGAAFINGVFGSGRLGVQQPGDQLILHDGNRQLVLARG